MGRSLHSSLATTRETNGIVRDGAGDRRSWRQKREAVVRKSVADSAGNAWRESQVSNSGD